tara:strand:- start:530 stop:1093 length:564 start_codon:yes stop_codon:yes gene_type:complete
MSSEKNKVKNMSKDQKIENGKKDADPVNLEEKLKETEEKLLRSLAEIENQRRRFEKEIKEAFDFGGFSFAKETISLLDNMQRAQNSLKSNENLKSSKEFDKFIDHINIIEKDLISVFERNNIKKIDCISKKFDPNFHQAMLEIEDETCEPGTIVKEIQPGYMYGDRLLRASFVGISKKKTNKKGEKN